MNIRRALLSRRLSAKQRRDFRRDGYLLIPNFIEADRFAALEKEAREISGTTNGIDSIQGDTLTRQFRLNHAALRHSPTLDVVVHQLNAQPLLAYVAGKFRLPFVWCQQILPSPEGSPEPDPQRSLHCDTFQPNMKAWLFISHADPSNGQFTFVPGSHRLSFARLKWEYQQSLIGAAQPNYFAARGSFRIAETDRIAMGLPPPLALNCAPNTLVVADTFGFHCRGPASDPDFARLELWALSRTNPFNPLPGLPFNALNRLDQRLFDIFLMLRNRIRAAADRAE